MDVFEKTFLRQPTKKESIILARLVNLYGLELVEEAVRRSVVVTSGSLINYIAAVAENLATKKEVDYNLIKQLTRQRLEDIQKHES